MPVSEGLTSGACLRLIRSVAIVQKGSLLRKPRRPNFPPKKTNRPPMRGPMTPGAGGPRVRSPLDAVGAITGVNFKVLGKGVDRAALVSYANPMEMVVIHGFTQEIDSEYQKIRQRPDDFWISHPELVEKAEKLDNVLATVQERRAAAERPAGR
jgi:hypothetical protein